MPAQKRSCENTNGAGDGVNDSLTDKDAAYGGGADAVILLDGTESDRTVDEMKTEFVKVKVSDIRKEVQCPICLGIIRKTRTVMECLHRFCRECIDKAMRLGNNECPACRTHCASRRSLRDDLNYDALIAVLYPDIDKYEAEELAFQEEETTRNKQIQASIAQTLQRQTEAMGRKKTPKITTPAITRRSQGRVRDTPARGRKNYRNIDLQGSDDNEDTNEGGKDSFSADERSTKRPKRSVGSRYSQPSSVTTDGAADANETEVNGEVMGVSAALIGPSDGLSWGRGGMRSHARYGPATSNNGKNATRVRASKVVDHNRSMDEKDNETGNQAINIAVTLGKDSTKSSSSEDPPTSVSSVSNHDCLQDSGEQETLAGLSTKNFKDGQLLLGHQKFE